MVKNLAEKAQLSSPIIIYNRTTSRAEKLHESVPHTTVAKTLEDAVHPADIIYICLGDDAAVTETVDAIAKLSSSNKSSKDTKKLIVDCSTIHPDTTTTISSTLGSSGYDFIAMPVFGAPAMADSGQLIAIPAGPSASWDAIAPYTKDVIARAVIPLADQPPSKATTLKLLGNTFILNMVSTLAESHVVAETSGLGTDVLHKWIETMWPGPYTAYSTRMLSGDYWKREEPLFAVDLARKDARHAMALAKNGKGDGEGGITLGNVMNGDALLKKVKEEKGPKGDLAGMYGAKRMEAGLPYEN